MQLTERDLQALFGSIKGWLTPAEGYLLYEYASESIGPIVEIGSYVGKSTLHLAAGVLYGNDNPLYTVDPHISGSESRAEFSGKDALEFYHNMIAFPSLGKIPRKLTCTSYEASCMFPSRSIGLLFVDGDHSFSGVREDLNEWLTLVKIGGKAVLHDWSLESVRSAAMKTSGIRQIEMPCTPNMATFEVLDFDEWSQK